MNKKARVGFILVVISLFVWGVYTMLVYIPAIQKDISNSNALTQAMVVAFICAILMIMGILIERK